MFEAAALSPGGMPSDPAQLMQELAAGDPRMAMLMQLMQAQRGEPSNDDSVPDDRDNLIAELSERLDASEARLTKMTRIARQLHEAGRVASVRLSRLAAALGACGICWGEDSSCLGCRGRGRPGMMRPDPEMRAELFGTQSPVRDASKHCH
ncbi:MAG: hypothetical protein IBJ12_16150 [Sphingomonadaceae bacterium]|nr:hypothetical protein [Sphingomonadaceae bacterium]